MLRIDRYAAEGPVAVEVVPVAVAAGQEEEFLEV